MQDSPEIANCDYCQWRSRYMYGWDDSDKKEKSGARTLLPLYQGGYLPGAYYGDYACTHPRASEFAPSHVKKCRLACGRANHKGLCPGYQPSMLTIFARLFGLRRKARLRFIPQECKKGACDGQQEDAEGTKQ